MSINPGNDFIEAPEPAEPVVPPARSRKGLVILVVGVVAFLAACGIGITVAAVGSDAKASQTLTPIQLAVRSCHAPRSWIGDGGHSLIISLGSDSPSDWAIISSCIWPKLKMPDSVKNRLFDTAAVSELNTSARTKGDWPGYHATVSASVSSFSYELNIIVSES